MKHRKHIRLQSFLMAVLLVATMLPAGSYTAQAANEVQLSFASEDPRDDAGQATVVAGGSVWVNEVKPDIGYVRENIAITNNVNGQPVSGGIIFPTGSGELRVAEGFNPSTGTAGVYDPTLSAEGVFTLTTSYYSQNLEGEVEETNAQGAGPRGGNITFSSREAITEYNECIIECTRAEYLNSPPTLRVVEGSTSGVFDKFAGATVVVDDYSQDATQPTKPVRFHLGQGNNRIDIEMEAQLKYSFETEDAGTAEDTGKEVLGDDGRPVQKPQPDNYIRKGTQFKLIVRMPQGGPLTLTVRTPQNAMEQIEEDIRSYMIPNAGEEGGSGNQTDFIRLLQAGDEQDRITGDFQALRATDQFNASFQIEWTWEPVSMTVDGVETAYDALTAEQQRACDRAVQPGERLPGSDWQTFSVTRDIENIKGRLVATVSYQLPAGGYQETNTVNVGTLPSKEIVIYGTGEPAEVIQVGETGKDGSITYDGSNTALPTTPKVMDAYPGDIPEYQTDPKGPYEYQLQLNMGAKNGAATYAVVSVADASDTDAFQLRVRQPNGGWQDYTPWVRSGTGDPPEANRIYNTQTNTLTASAVGLLVQSKRLPQDSGPQNVTLTISFYVPNSEGVPVESSERFTVRLNLNDSTPSQDSTLDGLRIRNQENTLIEYPFSSEQYLYSGANAIHLPYRTERVSLFPIYNEHPSPEPSTITLLDSMGNQIAGPVEAKNGEWTELPHDFEVNQMVSVQVVVPSVDPREEYWTTYQLDLVRDPPSEDNTLKSLGIYFPDDTSLANNLVTNFDPNTTEYYVEIPYSTERLRVRAEKNDPTAEGPTITPELVGSNWTDRDKQWLDDLRDKFANTTDGILDLTFEVISEAGAARTYTVHIRRQDPNTDASLSALEVTDNEEQALAYTPSFRADTLTYTLDIPYSTGQIKLNLTPADENVYNIQIYSRSVDRQNLLYEMQGGQIKPGTLTPAIDLLPLSDPEIAQLGYHALYIVVTAEDETTTREYLLRVRRAEPNDDASLSSLVLADQDGSQIRTFAFHPDETDYPVLLVPYETTGISFTPTASDPNATIRINEEGFLFPSGSDIGSGTTSKVYDLKDPGKEKKFEIVVTAEDGETTRTYTILVERGEPSHDARLKALSAGNVDSFEPLFISSTTDYEAVVSIGAPGVTITATANHPGATIRINGEVVTSGQASQLIELIEIEQEILIEVTAQDGETTEEYTITFTNQNLIERTSNADLRRLTVNYGQMTPGFKPAVTEYEVAATENTYSVDIIPRVADSLATMRVMSGSREIGDYNGNYSLALQDGANDISIEVTSPDGTVTKTYSVTVYRNEEDELKNLTPLEAEDIDFENSDDVILVMIDEYPRVSASVFEELKNYPEKTIIFQGNDYSLEFKASELTRVIPQTEIYDFRMYFISPDEDAIYDIIDRRSSNDNIIDRAVMLYFPYHGSLPGPATFHLSLGRQYANETLYWHYYNIERDRIDYYGTLKCNNRGTLAVTIDHFSTYILTPRHRIAGSEDMQGVVDELGMVSDGSDVIELPPEVKEIPYTGAEGEGRQ